MQKVVVIFGESTKGEIAQLNYYNDVVSFYEQQGEETNDGQGIAYGVKTLVRGGKLLFCRVREEGFSWEDYNYGARRLEEAASHYHPEIIYLPGVGDQRIYEAFSGLCEKMPILFGLGAKDFYDYMTR